MPAVMNRGSLTSRALASLAACLLAVFVVELSPHLVHHVADTDAAQSECPFAIASEREQVSLTDTVAIPLTGGVVSPVDAPAIVSMPEVARLTFGARAPPALIA